MTLDFKLEASFTDYFWLDAAGEWNSSVANPLDDPHDDWSKDLDNFPNCLSDHRRPPGRRTPG